MSAPAGCSANTVYLERDRSPPQDDDEPQSTRTITAANKDRCARLLPVGQSAVASPIQRPALTHLPPIPSPVAYRTATIHTAHAASSYQPSPAETPQPPRAPHHHHFCDHHLRRRARPQDTCRRSRRAAPRRTSSAARRATARRSCAATATAARREAATAPSTRWRPRARPSPCRPSTARSSSSSAMVGAARRVC